MFYIFQQFVNESISDNLNINEIDVKTPQRKGSSKNIQPQKTNENVTLMEINNDIIEEQNEASIYHTLYLNCNDIISYFYFYYLTV